VGNKVIIFIAHVQKESSKGDHDLADVFHLPNAAMQIYHK
jgi:hypothetical protein